MGSRTKIVATVGPSTQTEEMIGRLIDSGATVFRQNLKHNVPQWHEATTKRIRAVARSKGVHVGILYDLQGPEVRIGEFRQGYILLDSGQTVTFTDSEPIGEDGKIILNAAILRSLKAGQRFYIDDGSFEFEVVSAGRKVLAKVIRGGKLLSKKSLNLPGSSLNLPVLSEKDLSYIRIGIESRVDFFALSFVRNAKDIEALRQKMKGEQIGLIAKIERPSAVENFDEILAASDGIMIGRGDLGIEIPLPMVPLVQKEIIRKCRESGKPVITATQMLESMIKNPRPTRAEVSDVANAILDGTDAIMLSAESATGAFPAEAVSMMAYVDGTITNNAVRPPRLVHRKPASTTEAISQAVDTLSHNPLDFKAITLLTETGRTARFISKFRPGQHIYAVTKSERVANQLALVWGVTPICMKFGSGSAEAVFKGVISELRKEHDLKSKDNVICVSGRIIGKEHLTSAINLMEVK